MLPSANLNLELLKRTALDVAKRLREQARQMRKDADALDAQANRLVDEATDA